MYPRGLNDRELAEQIAEISADIEKRYGQVSGLLPELYLAYLQVGVQEQSRRLAADASEDARRATRISFAVAAVALVVAND